MESSLIAAGLLHPVALAILVIVLVAAVFIGTSSTPLPSELSRLRVLGGFAGIVVAGLLFTAVSSYVSPEEAKRFGVTPENYASALWRQFVVLATLVVYLGLIGCAFIGLPITLALAKRGLATTPMVIAASVPISLALVCFLGLASSATPTRLARHALYVAGSHAFLAFGFALGARLPWRRQRQQ
jgi:divalent metal cation (Fe/Co/Zn/Cd) transporter